MKHSKTSLVQFFILSLIHVAILFSISSAKQFTNPDSHTTSHGGLDNLLHRMSQWRNQNLETQNPNPNFNTIIAWILCFMASSVSSAGGIGGGSLFLPILTLISGLSLKSAAVFSSFMVTAGSLSNVLYTLCFMDKPLINYDIALLSQPCMLLGVSIGILCNIMFPEWLITALFAMFLACSTVKTAQSGCKIWREETEEAVRLRRVPNPEEDPLLEKERQNQKGNDDLAKRKWKDMVMLVMVWMCFFVLHLLLGDKDGKGVIRIKPCGVLYWLINLSQIPFAIGFTSYILYIKRNKTTQHAKNNNLQEENSDKIKNKIESLPAFVFPTAALLTGAMSGLFGIGGGLLLNPVFLHIGVPPQISAATSSFMVMFSSSMSMVQFIILGMKGIYQALIYALICFFASIVGVVIVQRAVAKSGRVSLLVFVVSVVMAISTVIITLFGVIDVWRQITNGDYMGFKLLC
ncbi:hypothetical protein LUZ60_005538 [Juncus effusus]|nr:hypothetical protein LUZ60_005538 [Juncus effusus]